MQRSLRFLINSTIESEYSGAAQDMSVYWFDNAEEYGGGDVVFAQGYAPVAAHLAQGLVVQLNQNATRITYGGTSVTVQTDSGASYSADRVIVAVPLGLLKSGKLSFEPALPSSHTQAISALQMGVLNKHFFKFDRVFWDSDLDWHESVQPLGQAPTWTEWVSFARPTGQPILMGFSAAKEAVDMEAWSDAAITADAMARLRSIFGSSIPNPSATLFTRWKQDPYTLGSYSFNALGVNDKTRSQLAQSISNRLYFAGEATESNHWGTVHGAYLSGVRAAQQIMGLASASAVRSGVRGGKGLRKRA